MAKKTDSNQVLRLAFWSGPRNISTALMRSWGNRPDTFVHDEPFYAHYLDQTGIDHPGSEEILTHHERDWRKVVAQLTGPVPGDKSIYYQKHMAHHLLPNMGREWFPLFVHGFLIRNPKEMLLSLDKKLASIDVADTGLPQQWEIFQFVVEKQGRIPPVIDSRDVLDTPREMLTLLCRELGVAFREEMLSWPEASRPTDGIWSKHWYESVERTTGFQAYRAKDEALPQRLESVYQSCMVYYEKLYQRRLRVEAPAATPQRGAT